MITGQKKLNVTYMASTIDEDGARIEGETCMDIQMAEEIADLLLQDKEDVIDKYEDKLGTYIRSRERDDHHRPQ